MNHAKRMARVRAIHGEPVHRIELFLADGVWMAESSDPEVLAMFGSAVLPTAWTASAPAWRVKQHMELCNPDSAVTVRRIQAA